MKKILILIPILILISAVFLFTNSVQARFPDDLPGPHIMPDSPFYFLKIWYEKIVLFFTFNPVKKAEKYKTFAEKRAYEAKEMIKEGKEGLAEKAKKMYREYLSKVQEKLEQAISKAAKQKKEELRQELERRIEEIKIKLKEEVIIW